MRTLEELINEEDLGWPIVLDWMKEAKQKVEILPAITSKAEEALLLTQITNSSVMGSIILETGGILVDHGWIRFLGSGCEAMNRSIPEWNQGKTFEEYGEGSPFMLVADDVIGGFFAVNGGGLGENDPGAVYYLPPDSQEWEGLGLNYSEFVYWTFTQDLTEFYEGFKWKGWEEDVAAMGPDKAMSFYPFLWIEFGDIEEIDRKPISVHEVWNLRVENGI